MNRRPRPSSFLLTLRVRSVRSWTSWLLRRSRTRLLREQRRTVALQLALDSSLLRQKELEQLEQMHQHRLLEMQGSLALRTQGLVLDLEQVSPPTELNRLLGLPQE